jgi:glycosyltransferase involved in cell wall biosynthesis
MKTLFVTVDPAFPPISGVDLRSWQNVSAASELGPVQLVSIGRPGPEIPPAGINIGHIAGIETSEVWNSDFDVIFPVAAIEQFRAICAQFQPDVTVLESLPLSNLASVARPYTQALVVDLHNVESDLVAQQARRLQDPEARRAMETRVRRIGAIEQKAAALADALWVCSSIDRNRLINDGADIKHIYAVPNGIPRPESLQDWPQRKPDRRAPTLLFIGHLGYPPNIEAALALVQLMPAVWERIAGARLILAGRNPHPVILSRSQPGKIDVVANPHSASPLLSNAHLAVMPLLRGGGTRIKALEAIAWGLPIVATARAVEGLQLEDGVHVRIAETIEAFVAAICDLCERPELYESQRIAAQRRVMENFGPEAIRREVHAGLRFALRAVRS